MALYRDPNSPYWFMDVTVGGERYRRSTKEKVKKAALRVERDFVAHKRETARLMAAGAVRLRLGDALDRLVKESDVRHAATRDSLARKIVAGPGYEGRFGLSSALWLDELTSAHVAELRAARRAEGNSPATVNREVTLLQRLYNVARREWGVRVRPDVYFPKYAEQVKTRYLTPDEEQALLRELTPRADPSTPPYAQQQDALDLSIMLLDTGCRVGELCNVPVTAIAPDYTSIMVYRQKVDDWATIALPKRSQAIVKRRREARPTDRYLFTAKDGGPRRVTASKAIQRAIDRAGLNADPETVKRHGKVTTHTMRHTFASKLVQNGLDLYPVKELLGHSNITTTQRYAALVPSENTKRAAAMLDALEPTSQDNAPAPSEDAGKRIAPGRKAADLKDASFAVLIPGREKLNETKGMKWRPQRDSNPRLRRESPWSRKKPKD